MPAGGTIWTTEGERAGPGPRQANQFSLEHDLPLPFLSIPLLEEWPSGFSLVPSNKYVLVSNSVDKINSSFFQRSRASLRIGSQFQSLSQKTHAWNHSHVKYESSQDSVGRVESGAPSK